MEVETKHRIKILIDDEYFGGFSVSEIPKTHAETVEMIKNLLGLLTSPIVPELELH